MITSSSNAQVKQMIQLNKKARERRKQDVFIVEGLRMFREVPRDSLRSGERFGVCTDE